MAQLLTAPFSYFVDVNGAPLTGGKVYTYAAGTTTPKATYTDSSGATALTNPVILDATGIASIWLEGLYKIVVTDANGVVQPHLGGDNISSNGFINDNTNVSFFQSFSGDGTTTNFTLSEDLGTDEKALLIFTSEPLKEYATNGDFATDTNWTKGAGWTIGAGVATATGAISTAISQTSGTALVAGQSYAVSYTITQSAGSLTPSLGGASGVARSASGTYKEVIIAGSSNQIIAFTGAGFTGTLDVVSVTPVNPLGYEIKKPSEFTLSGTSLIFGIAPRTGTDNIYVFAPSRLFGAIGGLANAASVSASEAAASATAASDSVNAAAAIYDSFDDRYLGSKATDPTLDNDGNALLTGALYWNTASNTMKVYSGSAWLFSYVAAGGFLVAANNLNDVSNAATARANLGAAPLSSPAFTDTPTAPTAANGTNTTQLATTAFVLANAPSYVKGSINGLLPSTQSFVSSTNATITFSNGQAVDSTGATLITGASLTQWSVANGNAVNGYQGGTTLPNSSTVHFFIICKSDGSSIGTFASTSLTPTLPATHTGGYYRRIASIPTNSSGVLRAAATPMMMDIQGGALAYFHSATLLDYNSSVTSNALVSLSVPSGIVVNPIIRAHDVNTSTALTVHSPNENTEIPRADAAAPLCDAWTNGATMASSHGFVTTNTSGQVKVEVGNGTGSYSTGTVRVATRGWIDFRRD